MVLPSPGGRDRSRRDGSRPRGSTTLVVRRIRAYNRPGFHPDDMRPGDCGCGIINHAIYYEQMER